MVSSSLLLASSEDQGEDRSVVEDGSVVKAANLEAIRVSSCPFYHIIFPAILTASPQYFSSRFYHKT